LRKDFIDKVNEANAKRVQAFNYSQGTNMVNNAAFQAMTMPNKAGAPGKSA
jgi:hypothetical protein